jgi:hypothetical protein
MHECGAISAIAVRDLSKFLRDRRRSYIAGVPARRISGGHRDWGGLVTL